MLEAKGISKHYGHLHVLKQIDVQIGRGEIVSIVGSSGAGKSTLLHILGTLDKPDAGELYFEGKRIDQLQGKALARFRNRHAGFVFQFHHLLPEFTASENICMPGWIAGEPARELEKRAAHLMEMLSIGSKRDSKPGTLSGGEQQRVAVARALINKPAIVFADEPTGNLDSTNATSLHNLFCSLRDELNQTFVIVTHNEELAALSNRILHLKDGCWVV
jgi:lipoprotein-releasing system ATP-binding protein